MNSTELKERLDKAIEKEEKIKKTIAKHQVRMEKFNNILFELGYNGIEDKERIYNENDEEAVHAFFGYRTAQRDCKSSISKLEDQEGVVKRYQERLAKQIEVERRFISEVPEAFKEAREALKKNWVEQDLAEQARMRVDRKEMERKDFLKKYSWSNQDFLTKTEEEFEAYEEKQTMDWVLDLYNRVYNITGKATDCSKLFFNGKALNGTVIGEDGTATVETILAGGYNIQRLHMRVLVK